MPPPSQQQQQQRAAAMAAMQMQQQQQMMMQMEGPPPPASMLPRFQAQVAPAGVASHPDLLFLINQVLFILDTACRGFANYSRYYYVVVTVQCKTCTYVYLRGTN